MAEVKMDSKEKQILDIVKMADKKPAEKIVTATVTEHKGIAKLGSDFSKEVLRPIMGNAVLDILRILLLSGADAAINYASMKFLGQPVGRTTSSLGSFFNGFGTNYINYNGMSGISKPISLRTAGVGMYQSPLTGSTSLGYSVKELKFVSKGDAELVRDSIMEYIDLYQAAEVARLYNLCGLHAEPQDFKYGWTSFVSAEICKSLDGSFILIPPKPVIIN